jgi:sirohydrochlorin ferrochelatase
MNTGILVLGHGSTLPYNKELVESISGMIAELAYKRAEEALSR